MKKILFDIETDGLLHEMTKIHCIVMIESKHATLPTRNYIVLHAQ